MHDLGDLACRDRVDVLLLQEPWYYQDKICGLPGRLRPFVSVGGRAAVVVVGEEIEAVLVCKSEWGVCVWLDAGRGGVYMASIYMQLRKPVQGALDFMNEILGVSRQDKVLIAIDANACSDLWFSKPSARSRDNRERAEELANWIGEKAMDILNAPTDAYTFSGAHGRSDIDVTLAKGWNGGDISWSMREDRGLSDHNPIYLCISELCRRNADRVESRCWFLAEARWAGLATSLQESAETLGFGTYFGMTAEEKVCQMDEWLTLACNECLRKKDSSKKRSLVWWSEDLEREKRRVRGLRKRVQRMRATLGSRREDQEEAWRIYKEELNIYKRMLADTKRQDWRSYVREEGNRDPWGGVTKILRSGRNGRGLASLRVGNEYTRTWKDGANVLLREFFPEDNDVAWRNEVQEGQDEWSESGWEELGLAIARLGNKKAPGIDGFRNEVLRATWSAVPSYVKEMFDSCLREGWFPTSWNEARVVTLLKAPDKDPSMPRSYRPVSLLNGWSKNVQRGCPQGSVGGPIIWNLCMDELLWCLEERGVGFAAFADDLTLLVEANTREQLVQRIKEEMAAVFRWGEKYGVQVSGEKTTVMLLKGELSFGRDPVVRVKWKDEVWRLKVVKEVKLLGLWMSEGMDVTKNVMCLRGKIELAVNRMTRVLRKEWGVKRKTYSAWMVGIFEAVAMYGASVWGGLMEKKAMRKEIQRAQRCVLYACLCVCRTVSTAAMQVLAGSPPWDLKCRMRRTLYKLKKDKRLDENDLKDQEEPSGSADDPSKLRPLSITAVPRERDGQAIRRLQRRPGSLKFTHESSLYSLVSQSEQRDSDSQLPVAEGSDGSSSLASSSCYPVSIVVVPPNPAAPDSVSVEKPSPLSRRNSVCSIASSISDAGSESKKSKVTHEDRTEVESEVAKHESCATLKIEQLEDETLVGLEKLRVKHKFTGSITDYVKQQLHAMKRIALELAIENTRLAAKNEYLSDLVDKRLSPSYSSVAARGAGASSSCPQFASLTPKAKPKSLNSPSPSVGRKKGKVKKSFVAVVSSSTEEPRANSDVLMSVLKSTIDPVGDGIHVRSVNKSRSGRLFVETASKQDLEKLISNAGLKARGVSVTLKERRLPRMIIYDVPVAHSGPELSELLRKQNPVLSPQHVLKPIFKVGKRDNEVTHWVMDVSPECRDVLVKEGGLYLGWRRCRVKEHCALTRCFKCQEFSHIAKYCKEKENTCGKCGEVGHTFKECTLEKQAQICVPCRRAKKPFDHFPDAKCPVYIAKLRKLAASVEGGDSSP
ncbi:unnamed protein product [Trichogramma brassicae]|uniref:CCHC-type domain-containing protein n=1 Tax=Trichogramma brassicae TaxID=86971 RepID=A0A6H5I8C2_9HYME|nr:unnamed protein product [Trichogramma brassicae]